MYFIWIYNTVIVLLPQPRVKSFSWKFTFEIFQIFHPLTKVELAQVPVIYNFARDYIVEKRLR